ncbi:MAG: lipopolysaccharide assembly LapA domain-containing protein [Bacteroidota bacterium]
MKRLFWGIAIASLAMIFALQNAAPVPVHLFFWKIDGASLALILLSTFIGGMATGILFLMPKYLKKSKELDRQLVQQRDENQIKN